MSNRATRRIRHKLTLWPAHKPSPIRGLKVGGNQKIWTCNCPNGWMVITGEKPVEAHKLHVAEFIKENSATIAE